MSKQEKMKRALALAALLAGTSGVANATEGWYGRGDIGWSFDGSVQPEFTTDFVLEHDWTEHLGLGYAFQNGFRVEGELSHRFNQMREEPGNLDDGDIHAWAAMANLFYDFNKGGGLEPYIGVGVGAARLNGSAFNGGLSWIGEDTVLAYQGMVGVAASVNEQLDIDVGFRYFRADEFEFDEGNFIGSADYEHQAITVGLRYQFAGEPAPVVEPPPPVVVPPPPVMTPPPVTCPQSDFVVYFEWDRSNLNQAALETIDAAVNRARQCNISSITVVGHTDTSGSPQYNQALSERRAGVVRDAMVARGIGAGQITTAARGESELARATRDGVREPLNRRTAVTITFQ